MNEENTKEETDGASFAELFEQSFKKPKRLEPGQKVEAVIVKITDEWVFLDLGGKSEGYLDKKELLDADGNLTAAEGDTISAYFLSSAHNEKLFTIKLHGGAAGNQYLEEAFHNHIPVEGVAEKEIKGGYEIKIAGTIRGFCPYSQMGLRRTEDPQDFIGKKLLFKITEYRDNGKSLVLSNRKMLEEEREQLRQELKKTLKKDMTVKGTVTSLRPFGAFVDIGGIEGLLPISEVGWSRVEDLSSVLLPGQEVEVKIMDLDWEKNKFSFSLKALLPDPWTQLHNQYPEESCHSGTVVRLAQFGAFVSLAPGIDGLIHISQLGQGKRINHPRDVLAEGQTVEVRVLKMDSENRRLSLGLAAATPQEQQGEDFRQYMEAQPSVKQASLGALGAALLKAREGKKDKR
ncbi:MAG: 30S ribosomal protein S1 [Deltaproteobacteria bacterium]|nr:30S ribosomal protein S1 [Deltaproteobacteria bacterium]